MQNRRITLWTAVLATLTCSFPAAVYAQDNSSINTFSPYTFYGVGDMTVQGTAFTRSMGGAGVAFSSGSRINTLNPASIGVMPRKSFLFNFEMEGQNVYSQSGSKKTSRNSFNIRDISIQMPLYTGMGLGVSISPFSNVGYKVTMDETDPGLLANAGNVMYNYNGAGSITQFKVSYGAKVLKKLYLGVDGIYYKGDINRYYDVDIASVLNPEVQFASTRGTLSEDYSKFNVNFGLNYDIIFDKNTERSLTFGATYQPKLNMKPTVTDMIMGGLVSNDTVFYSSYGKSFYMPDMLTVGLSYQSKKLSAVLDYSLQHWKGLNRADMVNGVKFGNTNSIKAGVQFIPDPGSARSPFRRWSYRMGVRYSDYYMMINDKKLEDCAITIGLGIPIKMQGFSSINIGAEFGRRGNKDSGMFGTKQYNMIKENYFKISIGLSMFGEDYWFVKHRYN